MSARTPDPARVFVRGMGLTEGLEWGFWLAATVWWVVVLDLSPLQLVGMGAVLEVTVLLAETPTGVVADMVSRRRSIMIGQIVMGAAYVWAVVSFDYWMILPAQALFGVGWTFRSGADTAWVTDELKGLDPDLRSLQEVRDAVERAHAAHKRVADFSQEQIDRVCLAMVQAASGAAHDLGKVAVEATGRSE